MPTPQSFQVAGVDGCRGGWFVAVASALQDDQDDSRGPLQLKSVFVAPGFAEVLSKTRECRFVCVDIPIGLSEGRQPRECDTAARKLIGGPRAGSVFPAPVRPCLLADDYDTASSISLQHSGKKLNRQSFALLKKIRQVDELMTPVLQEQVREIHPEVSFYSLNNNEPVRQNKRTVPGQAQRHKLLQRVFGNIEDILSGAPARGYGMDDALDALVAAWTAAQVLAGKAKPMPENPKLDNKGLRMEIVYPAGS
jgi:predicted RNase H-like nuclease